MPWGWMGIYANEIEKPPVRRVGRPDRGDRAKVKAGRKAARRR